MRFQTLSAWLAWQESLHPVEIELGLERVAQVWAQLPQLDRNTTVIVVAGTNGKGSSVAMLEAIYLSAGYTVGSYTSPHLCVYNERIKLNATPIADDELCEAFQRVDDVRADISLSYFEFGTLAALSVFSARAPEIVLLEVGLGGRLDAVNIVDADVVLITSIGLDHQAWLGDDRETIGLEKAGVIRRNRAVVYADRDPIRAIKEQSGRLNAPYYGYAEEFSFEQLANNFCWRGPEGRLKAALPIPALRGQHQLVNAAGVIMVSELLHSIRPVSMADLRSGLLSVKLKGRFEVFPGEVSWIFDVAHNEAAVKELAANLHAYAGGSKVHAVFAAQSDKDIAAMFAAIQNQVDSWYLTRLPTPRGATSAQLVETAAALGIQPVRSCPSVCDAVERVSRLAKSGDIVLVFGSFVTVAEATQCRTLITVRQGA